MPPGWRGREQMRRTGRQPDNGEDGRRQARSGNGHCRPMRQDGAPDTNRTCDPPLRRGMLYPLSYGGKDEAKRDSTRLAGGCANGRGGDSGFAPPHSTPPSGMPARAIPGRSERPDSQPLAPRLPGGRPGFERRQRVFIPESLFRDAPCCPRSRCTACPMPRWWRTPARTSDTPRLRPGRWPPDARAPARAWRIPQKC